MEIKRFSLRISNLWPWALTPTMVEDKNGKYCLYTDVEKHVRMTAKEPSKITESIWVTNDLAVPLADVQHIEKRGKGENMFLMLIMKSTRYNTAIDGWDNAVYIQPCEVKSFMQAWCTYRGELDNSNGGPL